VHRPACGHVVVTAPAPADGVTADGVVAKTGHWTYELHDDADEF